MYLYIFNRDAYSIFLYIIFILLIAVVNAEKGYKVDDDDDECIFNSF